MRIVNMSRNSVSVKITTEDKKAVDYVTVMPKKQVTLPEGFVIEPNWAVANPLVRPVKED